MTVTPEISIVTCCFNSAGRLANFFSAIRELQVPPGGAELVLVDNASTDATPKLLTTQADWEGIPACVVREENPGLMHARRRGVAASRGRFVLFLDDDNEPSPDYLIQLSRLAAAYPDAALITGNCLLPSSFDARAPISDVGPLLIVRELRGEFEFALTSLAPECVPWGAGMFARRESFLVSMSAWERGGDGIVGRQAHGLGGGEDLWLAHHITRDGHLVVFSDKLVLKHRLERNRLQANYLARLGLENGLGRVVLVESIRRFKPTLDYPQLTAIHVLRASLISLPLKVLRCIWSGTPTSLARAVDALGYAFALVTRQSGR